MSDSCTHTGNLTTAIVTCNDEQFTPYIFNNNTRQQFQALSYVLILTSVVGTVLNFTVLMAMFPTRSNNRLHLNKFLMTLTLIDLLAASVGLPIYAHYDLLLSEGAFCCNIGNILLTVLYPLILMSITTIAAINLQLCMAILRPFLYDSEPNRQLSPPALATVNSIWLLFTVLAVHVYPHWWTTFRMVSGIFALLVYITISCLHFFICRESRRIRKRSQSNASLACTSVTQKTIRLASSVLISFGLLYLPYTILSIYTTIFPITPYINTYFDTWAELIGITTCVCNPILYCIRLDSVRRSIKQRLWGKKGIDTDRSYVSNSMREPTNRPTVPNTIS